MFFEVKIMMLPLAAVSFIMKVTAFIWIFVTIALILLILVQKGRGGGLSGAFGGAGGSSSLLGTKTGDFLTWVTIGMVVVFLTLAVVLVKYYKPTSSSDLSQPAPITQQEMPTETPEIPVAPVAPEAPAIPIEPAQ
jgi:preprotein translocase subunit SecG